jgi:hypothetical protein
VSLQDLFLHIFPDARFLPLSHLQHNGPERYLRQLYQNVSCRARRGVYPSRSLFLRLRGRHVDQSVPTTGRVYARHRHTLRLGSARRVSYSDGQLTGRRLTSYGTYSR